MAVITRLATCMHTSQRLVRCSGKPSLGHHTPCSSLEAAAHEGAQLLPGLLAGLREQFHNASRSDEYQTQVYSSGWPTSPDRFERIGNMYMTSPMALRHAAAQIEHLVSVGIMDASFVSHAGEWYRCRNFV